MQIRPLRTHADYLAAEQLQRDVWHFPDRELIPLNELVVAQKHGGHVFGAFDRGRLVGFCFGVPGFRDGRTYHYSRMLGVRPGIQDRGLGYRMKLLQRKFVLGQGLDLVRWTFDPLQSRNAHFNVEKLGVVIREYLVNVYGESGSRFNRGLETDRFVTEWHIRSRRVLAHLKGRKAPTFEEASASWIGRRRLAVEIPSDIDVVKKKDLREAQDWRRRTRAAFLSAFRRGYVVTGFAAGRARSLYLLEKDPDLR